ncbi:DsbA family protein [Pseudomonas neustonica]|uniref:DsbA family protein n=1 Tax=Pseudomonas neustonica TaxID=2487346 RepID=UPI003F469B97|tara:strand:+ start:16281 stop:17081 length:801 start_codon:yes stop_codon:yes gene_type:complete
MPSKFKSYVPTILAVALSVPAVTVGFGLVVSYMINQEIESEVARVLPNAIKAATTKIEQEKQALQVQAALSGWDSAVESMPEGRNIYGSLNAEFSLVEFSDLECGFCKRLHPTPKSLVEQSAGRINWEWRHFPLSFHNPSASGGAHAAMCVSELAGNKAFWAFTGAWFKASGMNGNGVAETTKLASSVGAPAEEFNACMQSQRYQDAIEKQVAEGTELGVTGTPGTFVVDNTTGNRVFVRGAQESSAYIQAILQLRDMRNQQQSEE